MFSLQLRQFLVEHFLSLLEEADSVEAVEHPTSIPRAYGQYGPDGSFTPKQATLLPRPGQAHTTVNLGGRRVALGDTPRSSPMPLQPPKGSPVVVLPLPDQPTKLRFFHELRDMAYQLGGLTLTAPSWALGDFQGTGSGIWMLSADAAQTMQFLETGEYMWDWENRRRALTSFPSERVPYGPVSLPSTGQITLALRGAQWEMPNLFSGLPVPGGFVFMDDSNVQRLIVKELPETSSYTIEGHLNAMQYMVAPNADSEKAFSFYDELSGEYYAADYTDPAFWESHALIFAGEEIAYETIELSVSVQPKMDKWPFYAFSAYFENEYRPIYDDPPAYEYQRDVYTLVQGDVDPEITPTPSENPDLYEAAVEEIEQVIAGGGSYTFTSRPVGEYTIYPLVFYVLNTFFHIRDIEPIWDQMRYFALYQNEHGQVPVPPQPPEEVTWIPVEEKYVEHFLPGQLIRFMHNALDYPGYQDDPGILPQPPFQYVQVTGLSRVTETIGSATFSYWRADLDRPVVYAENSVIGVSGFGPKWEAKYDGNGNLQPWEQGVSQKQIRCRYKLFRTDVPGWIPSYTIQEDIYAMRYRRGALVSFKVVSFYEYLHTNPDNTTEWRACHYGQNLNYFTVPRTIETFGNSAGIEGLTGQRFIDNDNMVVELPFGNAAPWNDAGGKLADELALSDIPAAEIAARDPLLETHPYSFLGAADYPSAGANYEEAERRSVFLGFAVSRVARDLPSWQPPTWTDPLTPDDLTLLEKLAPVIYADFSDRVSLANPLLPDKESKFFGITFMSQVYVADAFYALLPAETPEDPPVEAFIAVAIYQHADGSFRVAVARDDTLLGEWPLLAFFPGAEALPLYFVDATPWPNGTDLPLSPHLNFLHFSYPGRDVADLGPFRARVRDPKRDKLGRSFAQAAADAPITLFLESYPDHDDL